MESERWWCGLRAGGESRETQREAGRRWATWAQKGSGETRGLVPVSIKLWWTLFSVLESSGTCFRIIQTSFLLEKVWCGVLFFVTWHLIIGAFWGRRQSRHVSFQGRVSNWTAPSWDPSSWVSLHTCQHISPSGSHWGLSLKRTSSLFLLLLFF